MVEVKRSVKLLHVRLTSKLSLILNLLLNAFGTITTKVESNMRSPDPRGEKLHQRGLSSVSRLWSDYTQKREEVGNQ